VAHLIGVIERNREWLVAVEELTHQKMAEKALHKECPRRSQFSWTLFRMKREFFNSHALFHHLEHPVATEPT
jgi:hypothetical protein